MKGELTPDPPTPSPLAGDSCDFSLGMGEASQSRARRPTSRTRGFGTPFSRADAASDNAQNALGIPSVTPMPSVVRNQGRGGQCREVPGGDRGAFPACHTQRVQSAGVTSWSGRGGSA